jgi:hypothetical protein
MNALLWIIQAVLALLYISGGAYKMFSFAELASHMSAIPHAGWRTLGVIEMVGGLLLILPAVLKRKPFLTPLAAAALTLETLFLAAVYAQYSLDVAVTNPLVWSVVMTLLAAFVAYGRRAALRTDSNS